jgi:hypothetical protein
MTPAISATTTASFTKKKTMPTMLLKTQKATITPTMPTATTATACLKVTGCLFSLRLTDLLTNPMLRSRSGP